MEDKIIVNLNEDDVRKIVRQHLKDKGYKVKNIEISIRSKDDDKKIPTSASGDSVCISATVESHASVK
jgi:hypothetical protein